MPFTNRKSSARRRGGVYVIVLGVALIVGVVGLTSVKVSQLELRSAVAADDAARARLAAQSGVAAALSQIDLAGGSWRSTYEHGVEIPADGWTPLGNTGEFKYALLDADADLTDDAADKVTIRSVGRSGGAVSVAVVTFAPDGGGFDCLASAVHSGDDVYVGMLLNSAVINGEGTLTAADEINVDPLSAVYLDSDQYEYRDMPDPTDVFEYYLANGTFIDIDAINSHRIEECVLSAGVNPYGGELNPLGIYVIDCEGQSLEIEDARINATLVVLNAAGGVRLENQLHWTPAVSSLPALMVQGNVESRWNSSYTLSESTLGVNFNPVGAPDADGVSDSDLSDSYEGVIRGLVYVTGELSQTEAARIEGCLLTGGDLRVDGSLHVTHDDAYLVDPPPGFADGASMSVVPGSWRRDSY